MIRMMSLEEAVALLGSPKWSNNFKEYCDDLKKNFRKLIVQFHSDKTKDKEKEELGKKLIEANSVIGDAIDKGDLLVWLTGKKETLVKTYIWADKDFSSEMESVWDSMIKNLGNMKKVLMELPEGLHNVIYGGFKFNVKCTDTGKIIRGEPEKIWNISNIEKIKEISNQVQPLALIFGK